MSQLLPYFATVFRGYLVRKKVKPMIEERKKAATTIQAKLRGYLFRKRLKQSKKEQESALKIQKGRSARRNVTL
jgi:myosin heavy subunit